MIYPFWEPGLSYGLLMAVIAITHVFISHFAVGGGLYLVVTEHLARRRGEPLKLDFLKKLSRFFILVTLVSGALTGVMIWSIIGLLNPAATEVLIRTFVWGWAIEWSFFIIEVAAAIFYYYGWDRMSARAHLITGWIYFAAAWLSLVVINGIIGFMLTPGDWLRTGAFWDGFFNPTYWPSLVFRTGITMTMAGLFCLWVTSRRAAPEIRAGLTRYNAIWALAGLAVAAVSFGPYLGAIPVDLLQTAQERMAIPMTARQIMVLAAGGLAVLVALVGLLLPRLCKPAVALALLLVAFVGFGAFEWFRESLRKPYAITGYSYAHGLHVKNAAMYKRDGLLQYIPRTGDDGADLYNRACASCHTLDGYNGLAKSLRHLDRAFIAGLVQNAHVMNRGNMPPFLGKPEEADLIAGYLARQIDARPLEEATGLKDVELGRVAFAKRCEVCHVRGARQYDVTAALMDNEEADLNDLLDSAGDLSEFMPAFTGGETQKKAIVQYLLAVKKDYKPAATPVAVVKADTNVVAAVTLPGHEYLPAPYWLINVLHILTLSLHFLATGLIVGGLCFLFLGRLAGGLPHPVARTIIAALPSAMTSAITLGVAPLLFLQLTLPGQAYSACIASGWHWLAITFAGITGYYLLYGAAFARPDGPRYALLAPAFAAFVYIALVLTSVSQMVETPGAGLALHAAAPHGLRLNPALGDYLPRWLHMLTGAAAIGGFFMTIFARNDAVAARKAQRFFTVTMTLAMILGVVYLATLADQMKPIMRGPAIWVLTVSVIAAFGAMHTAAKNAIVSGALLFVSLLGMVYARHLVRLISLGDPLNPANIPLRPQWDVFALFLISFVAALGLVAWMVVLFLRRRNVAA